MPLFFIPPAPMLYEQINAWLTHSDDYDAGLALLRETGYTGFTLTILSKGADAYNRTRLETELRTWLDNPNNILPIMAGVGSAAPGQQGKNLVDMPTTPVPALTKKPTPAVDSTDQIPKNQSSAVDALRQRSYGLMDERAELKARLRAKMDEGNDDAQLAERLPWALRIKAITRQLDEIYSQLDFYEQHGYLPKVAADPAVEVDDTAALMNVRSYVSRYRGKLKKKNLTPEQRGSFEKLLTEYEQEKQRLELKLNRINDSHSTGQQTTDCPNHSPVFSRT